MADKASDIMARLFILKSLGRGGAEIYLLRFLTFCNSRTNNYVLVTSGKTGVLEKEYKEVCSVVDDFKLDKYSLKEYRRFKAFLKEKDITTICDFRGNFSGLVLRAAKKAGVNKRIAFYRESVNQYSPSLLKDIVASLYKTMMVKSATRVLANSHAALDHFHPGYMNHAEKFGVIYNGFFGKISSPDIKIEVKRKLGIPESIFVIGNVGRFTPAKNHPMIIHCAKALCAKHDDVCFVLVGKDVDTHYSKQVEEAGLTGRIILTGQRDDIPDLLTVFDLFYFPSLNEGQPNALIEAMCNGIPYVASDIPSIKETVDSESYGKLVGPNDFDNNLLALEESIVSRRGRDEALKEWARNKFDADKLFRAFENEL